MPGEQVTSDARSPQTDRPVTTPKFEQVVTHEVELLEIAVNTDLPDAVFAPRVPGRLRDLRPERPQAL